MNRRKCFRSRSGFTLIELIVVMSILSMIMSVLYSSFLTGLAAYRRTEEIISQKNEGDVFLVQLERELRNAVPYFHPNFKVYFTGKASSISFPTALFHYTPDGTEEDLYIVEYEFLAGSLVRKERRVKEKSIGREEKRETLFEKLETFRFEYLVLDQSDKIHWAKDWLNEPYLGIPRAVRFTVSGDIFGKEMKVVEILIPQGLLLKSGHE